MRPTADLPKRPPQLTEAIESTRTMPTKTEYSRSDAPFMSLFKRPSKLDIRAIYQKRRPKTGQGTDDKLKA